MNFYFLFIVFLSTGECNARVVPLDFKTDKSKQVDSNFLEIEVFEESPPHEVEILSLGLPGVEQSNDSNLSNSEKNSTTVLEMSNRNASNLSIDLTIRENNVGEESKLESAESSEVSDIPDEEFKSVAEFIKKDMGEKSKLDSAESSELSDVSDEEFKSVSEFISKNNLDSKDLFLNNKTSDFLTFKNETSMANKSSHDLEQETDFRKVEDKILDAFNQEETIAASEIINGNQNETIAASEIINGNQNETIADPEIINSNQNETIADPEIINSNQNETIAASEIINSNQNKTFAVSDLIISDQNKTFTIFQIVNGTNSSNNLSEVQSLADDAKVEVFLSDTKNITENFKPEGVASENLESHDSVKAAGGILSGFGFLINSEVARNAAKAMEVFNFSDPLTDHIIEENEFHSFLPAFNAEQGLDSSNQADSKTAIIINGSGVSIETRSDFNTSLSFENATSVVLNKTELEEIKNSFIPINSSELLEARNKTELSNLGEKSEGNATLEPASPLENSKEKIQPASEATPSKQNINASVDVPSIVSFPECPPPGWCIFWFLSQDTCAVNEHCLGSRICCKIRCSKTCIEVESP